MSRFRKRPVEIQAVQWHGNNAGEVTTFLAHTVARQGIEFDVEFAAPEMKIKTLEGVMTASPGDWLICGVQGELYPCKPAIFAETYEQAEPTPAATEAETTTHVLSALHRSAEQDVTRVIELHEQWTKAGPPPLGTSMARWWDARLAELHDAIAPPRR